MDISASREVQQSAAQILVAVKQQQAQKEEGRQAVQLIEKATPHTPRGPQGGQIDLYV